MSLWAITVIINLLTTVPFDLMFWYSYMVICLYVNLHCHDFKSCITTITMIFMHMMYLHKKTAFPTKNTGKSIHHKGVFCMTHFLEDLWISFWLVFYFTCRFTNRFNRYISRISSMQITWLPLFLLNQSDIYYHIIKYLGHSHTNFRFVLPIVAILILIFTCIDCNDHLGTNFSYKRQKKIVCSWI